MICRLRIMNQIGHPRRETQCGDVVMKMEGRINRGRSSIDGSIVLVNGEEGEFKPEPCAQMEEGEEAVGHSWLADTS